MARGGSGIGFVLSSMSNIIVSIRVMGFIIVMVFYIFMIVSSVFSLNTYWNKSWLCWISVLWFLTSRYEVFSFAGFVYYRVYGSQENNGLQYEVPCMELCVIVTKALWLLQVEAYANVLYFIGFCLWYRNTTFVLWMGVRKRVGYLQKAGLRTMFGSSFGANLLVFGMVYRFGYRDEEFRIFFWMRLLCWVSLNPAQRVFSTQKMGLCREGRLGLMVLNKVRRRLTLSYEMELWNKVHKVGQLYVRRGIYGVHLTGKIFSMAFTILTFGCVLEYMYLSYNRFGCWDYYGSNKGYMGFIKVGNYLLVWYNKRNDTLDFVSLGTMEILDWQIHEFVHATVWKIVMTKSCIRIRFGSRILGFITPINLASRSI